MTVYAARVEALSLSARDEAGEAAALEYCIRTVREPPASVTPAALELTKDVLPPITPEKVLAADRTFAWKNVELRHSTLVMLAKERFYVVKVTRKWERDKGVEVWHEVIASREYSSEEEALRALGW